MEDKTIQALKIARNMQNTLEVLKEQMIQLKGLGYEDNYIMQELTGGYIGTMLADRIESLPDDIVLELEE